MTTMIKERFVAWALEPGGVYRFTYKRNGEKYTYRCLPGYRRECLREIARDGSNPDLSLDYYDVVAIAARVRQVVPIADQDSVGSDIPPADLVSAQTLTTTIDLERAEFDDLFSASDGTGSVAMLGGVILFCLVFCAAFIWLAIKALG